MRLEIESNHTTFKPSGGGESRSDSYLFGPKLVLDLPLADKTAFFVDLAVGLAQEKDDVSTMNGFGLAVGAGVKSFVARSFSVDLGLQYRKLHVKGGGDSWDTSALQLGAALSVYFANAGH